MLSGPCWNHIQACWWPLLVFKFSCSKPVRWLWLQLYNFSDIQRVPPTDPRHPSTCFVWGAGHPFQLWIFQNTFYLKPFACTNSSVVWFGACHTAGPVVFFAQVSMLWQILLKQNRTGLRHGAMMGCKRLTPRMTPHKWGMNVMSHEA